MRYLTSFNALFSSAVKLVIAAGLFSFASVSSASVASWEGFDGATIAEDTYTFPAAAQSWAGFSNNNSAMYPLCFGQDGSIDFTGAVTSDGSATINFVLERLPYNTEGNGADSTLPNITGLSATVSGAAESSYSIPVPAQAAENTYSSFVMYIVERDVDVVIKDVTVNSPGCPASISVEGPGLSSVGLINYTADATGSTIVAATDNGDGTFTADLLVNGTLEYLWINTLTFVPEDLTGDNSAGLCESDEVNEGSYRIFNIATADGESDTFGACDAIDTDNDGIVDVNDPDDDNDGINDENDVAPLDPEFSDKGAAMFSEAFGDTVIETGPVYTFPTGAQSWGGFANLNTELYPIYLSEAGTITFDASVPSGGSAEVYFRLEKNPHPDVEPSYNTDPITVSGADTVSYTVALPSQGENSFRSFLMYVTTPDVAVAVSNVVVNADANSGGGVAPATGGTITFQVDMTGVDLQGQVPTVNGTFNNWCGACASMTDEDGDNVWTIDVELESGSYEYKFALGAWVDQETVPGECALDGTAEFVNRFVSVDGSKILAVTPWSGCPTGEDTPVDGGGDTGTGGGDTGTGGGDSVVTFSVDMTGVDLQGQVPTVNGTFNNWCGECAQMSDDDGDNVWTIDITLADGAYEYKYALGAWVAQETVPAECALDANAEFVNRALAVAGADIVLDTTPWSGCASDTSSTVTFSVDMTGVNLQGQVPTVNGVFNNWCGDCAQMSDDDGDNVWTISIDLEDGSYDYKYALGAWVDQESVPSECGISFTLEDGTPGVNRNVVVSGADINLPVVPWSGCAAGSTNAIVTFSVDMTGVDLQGQVPTVNGTFNNWCGNCAPMTDDDGDNVWTLDIELAPNTDGVNSFYEYKYALGAWVAQETVPAECALVNGEFANRTVSVGSDNIVLDTTPWSGCPGGNGGPTEPEFTPADGFQFTEAFSGTTIDGSVYTFPGSADSWAGFANMNTSLYPMTVAEDSVITFTGSVPAGGDAVVRFRFEANPYPNTEPSFDTGTVTVSGADAATYSISVPSQGANTFNSFIMYLDTRDVGVSVTDIAIDAAPVGPADSDNDGVNDDEDAFPNDPSETVDTDNDGIGNNADTDDDGDGVADAIDADPLDASNTTVLDHQSVFVVGSPKGMVGSAVSVTVGYDVSNDDSTLTGLGLNIHYDSSVLEFDSVSDLLTTDNISQGAAADDTDDLDGDASTDKYITANWASLFGNWPGTLPSDLLTATFNVADDDSLVSTVINFSATSNAAGYAFAPTNYSMDIISGSFDFDASGTADALTDGLLLLRYTFGLRGESLTAGAIASASTMTSSEVEAAVADSTASVADIDGSGNVDALTDGLLLLRYLFGLRGDSLVSGAIAGSATRTTAADVEAYIISMIP